MFVSRCLRSGFAIISKVSSSNFAGSHTFHTTSSYCAIDKVLLSELRKKTGFSLSHCKNALEQNENDIENSKLWLLKEAQAHGWAKASKLGSRATPQGLIGVYIDRNVGGLVEVNCETDFVAKNEDFRELVNSITKEVTLSTLSSSAQEENSISKIIISKEELDKLQTSEGKTLADIVALSVGKIGENIQVTRAVKISSPPELQLRGYVHPPSEKGGLVGKYATIVAFKNANDEQLTKQLCAHIIGLNPTKIGTFEDLEETTSSDQDEAEDSSSSQSETSKSSSSSEDSGDESEEDVPEKVEEEVKEEALLLQKFLADSDLTVGQVLKENDVDIIDFVRLECGETQKEVL